MFAEIASSAVATYHPNKNSIHQYELHQAFKLEKVGKLMKHIKSLESQLGFKKNDLSYLNRTDSPLDRV